MNYVLQVVRGRADANTIKLMEGVNSVGRHDDCLIRIRSSQVSRRHCEVFEDGSGLILRDLGSANGTYVNGKRVLGQQSLKPGDVLTIGGVTLRVDLLQGAPGGRAATAPAPKPGDTAELAALPVSDEEFEVDFEEEPESGPEPDHIDLIPLDDDPPPATAQAQPAAPSSPGAAAGKTPQGQGDTTDVVEHVATPPSPAEEDAVAQFLMDLKLDEED